MKVRANACRAVVMVVCMTTYICFSCADASIEFDNISATVHIKKGFCALSNPDKVTGWGLFSITRGFYATQASQWPEQYQAGVEIGIGSDYRLPAMNMIEANSDAIGALKTSTGTLAALSGANSNTLLLLNRTTSAALLYGDRVNSSALCYGDRTNSNALVLLDRAARAMSSALMYGDRVNSNATVLLDETVRVNSNALMSLSMGSISVLLAQVRYNSNAICYTTARINSGYLGPTRYIAPDNPLTFTSDAVYNGGNNIIQFSSGTNLIDVAPATTVVFNNVILNDFSPQCYAPSATQGDIIFGDKTIISLGINPLGGSSGILVLNYTWTLSGSATIDGKDRTLLFGPLGNIVVTPGSFASINNLSMINLNGNNLRCLSDTSRIYLHSVDLVLDNNFSFTTGSLDLSEECLVSGTYTFAYQSAMTSTISAYASLTIDSGLTFSYDPVNGYQRGIAFIDKSSVLRLKASCLHTAKSGMNLIKGTLAIEDSSSFVIEGGVDAYGNVAENGIILGDNTTDENDCLVDFQRDALLDVYGGGLLYRNCNLASWNMNGYASLLRLQSTSLLRLDQSLDIGEGRALFSRQASLQIADGKQLIGTIGNF